MQRIVAEADGFIQAEIAQPLTVAAIAEAARTSTRTLHRAFLYAHQLTPMNYLKRERLNAARRCLLAAEPGDTTVAQTARQHGFFHLGRFAIVYRHVFAESPLQTLRG